jgi:hypothetical protein
MLQTLKHNVEQLKLPLQAAQKEANKLKDSVATYDKD